MSERTRTHHLHSRNRARPFTASGCRSCARWRMVTTRRNDSEQQTNTQGRIGGPKPTWEFSRRGCARDGAGSYQIYNAVTAVNHISFTLKPLRRWRFLAATAPARPTTIAMLLGPRGTDIGLVRIFGADISCDRKRLPIRINSSLQSPYVDLPMPRQ